jgi:hypothetical protein
MLEGFQRELNFAYVNRDGRDISDLIRGKIRMLSEVILMKQTFSEVDKLKEAVETAKKGVR